MVILIFVSMGQLLLSQYEIIDAQGLCFLKCIPLLHWLPVQICIWFSMNAFYENTNHMLCTNLVMFNSYRDITLSHWCGVYRAH